MAARKSPKTIRGYVSTAFAEFGQAYAFPDDVARIRRNHMEDYLIDVQEKQTTSTVATYFAHLQQFFRSLVEVEQ